MDRIIVYPGAIPLDTDLLATNRNTLVALHGLIAATYGAGTAVDGLTLAATSPPSMNIVVAPGMITASGPLDASAYGSLGSDTTDGISKMATMLQPLTLGLGAPTTAGTAIAYLVEAGFSETDQNPVVLPYYNAANPAMPYLGPANSGAAQYTLRQERVAIQLKSGAAAPIGAQVLPPADPGFVALGSIVVQAGATQINPGDIAASLPLRATPWKLPDLRPGFAFGTAFTSAGTSNFVVPVGITRLRVTVIGGGGAGGTHASQPGGGGGAGARGELWLYGMTPGTVIPVTVGNYGAASGTPANGGTGGTSSFGSYVSATGGAGGGGGSGGGVPQGGAGGSAVGAAIGYTGGWGGDAIPVAARGGDGGGPGAGKGGTSANGMNAPGVGGGGGGGGTGAAGGAGGGGFVFVEY